MTCLSVQLGDLIIDGDTEDGDGHIWTWTILDGWFDSTAVRVAQQEVPGTGETITLARENARAITLEIIASNPGLPRPPALGLLGVGQVRVQAKAAGHAVFVPKLLIVQDTEFGAGHLSAFVRRVGPMKDEVLGDAHAMRFQFPLLAPDPLRYEGTGGSGTGHE